ncbi:unnamed protein product, partial [Pylaiella littoralis]
AGRTTRLTQSSRNKSSSSRDKEDGRSGDGGNRGREDDAGIPDFFSISLYRRNERNVGPDAGQLLFVHGAAYKTDKRLGAEFKGTHVL